MYTTYYMLHPCFHVQCKPTLSRNPQNNVQCKLTLSRTPQNNAWPWTCNFVFIQHKDLTLSPSPLIYIVHTCTSPRCPTKKTLINDGPFCQDTRAIKVVLLPGFACFASCWEFCFSYFCLPSSFSFIFCQSSSNPVKRRCVPRISESDVYLWWRHHRDGVGVRYLSPPPPTHTHTHKHTHTPYFLIPFHQPQL